MSWPVKTGWELKKRGGIGWSYLLLLLLLFFAATGCAAGVRSSLVEMEMRLALPLLSRSGGGPGELPVAYPAAPPSGSLKGKDFPLAEFGPAWRGLEPVYSEYRFNPFNP